LETLTIAAPNHDVQVAELVKPRLLQWHHNYVTTPCGS